MIFRLTGADSAMSRFSSLADRAPRAATLGAVAAASHIEDVMKSQFLSGQALRRVTSPGLFGSWNVRGVDSPSPGAILATNVPYARAQELGAKMDVTVKSHRRRKPFSAYGLTQRTYRSASRSRRGKFTKARTAYQESEAGAFSVEVRSHPRRMNLEARYYLDAEGTHGGAVAVARGRAAEIAFEIWSRESGLR